MKKNIDDYNVFLTSDIYCEDVDFSSEEFERYEFTLDYKNFLEYCETTVEWDSEERESILERIEAINKIKSPNLFLEKAKDFATDYETEFDDWQDNEEKYQIPMMFTVRFYPSFVSFTEADRYATSGATCLIYDTELDRWGVAMTGGGMDLTPQLIDTFINLGKGVPHELAQNMTKDWLSYVDKDKHLLNCKLLSKAFLEQADRDLIKAVQLDDDIDENIKRHIKGIEKILY